MAVYNRQCSIPDGFVPNANCSNNGGVEIWTLAPNDNFNISIAEFNSLALEGLMFLAIVWGLALIIKIAKEL